MIDLTTKQQQSIGTRKKKTNSSIRRHDAINLPKNLIDSDSDAEHEEKSSSEDDNDGYPVPEVYYNNNAGPRMNKLSHSLLKMHVSERDQLMKEALKRITQVQNQYREGLQRLQSRYLKARSPYRNKIEEHKKNKQYGDEFREELPRHDLTVTTTPGMRNGGRVFVQSVPCAPVFNKGEVHSVISDDVLAQEQLLNDTVNDTEFLASLTQLTADELDQVFCAYGEQEGHRWTAPRTQVTAKQMLSPVNLRSPSNLDLNDSSYETGSPCSTVVTSPGGFSPNRTSISSESDQEVDTAVESSPVQVMRNVVVVPATRRIVVRPEPTMRPLGEAVNLVQASASDRLLDFQNSTSFCRQQFIVQLVQVFMSASSPENKDKVEAFAKSLMRTMKMKIGTRATEGDIWQLSILAHIQFLLPRASEYRAALDCRDEYGHSLLYIAAVQHHKKPLIARYIAESMMRLNINPLQCDDKGNTIMHVLASLGDSHVHVLGELLVVLGTNTTRTSNKAGQTPLHAAVQSPHPHTSTTVVLLQKGANPLALDGVNMTALHYHLKCAAGRLPRLMEDVELVRKMIHSPLSMSAESLQTLELLRADPSVPSDLGQLIFAEINKYCIKDVRPKKSDRRAQ